MARLGMTGAEIDLVEWFNNGLTVLNGSAPTLETVNMRSGVAAWNHFSGGSSASYVSTPLITRALSTTYYIRAYFNFSHLPGSTVVVLIAGATGVAAKLTSGGKLQLFNMGAGTQIGSDSAATINTGTWYRIELSFKTGSGAVTTYTDTELMLDGVSVASASGLSITGVAADCHWGWYETPGSLKTVITDDVALNDSTGANNNSWPGDAKIIMMRPISDNARGAWDAGAGGTTNLWDAVNNTPPVGVSDSAATNTSQIRNKSTTNPSSCDFNLATYTAAGVGSTDTINAMVILDVDGEDPTTSTKTGACSMVSNPVIAEPSAFNFGDDGASAQGIYLSNWKWHAGVMTEAPSVTKGTAPVLRIRCISGATNARAASCCALGAYVDYSPGAAVSLPPFAFQGINSNRLR